jgi:hypothetical protein
VHSRRPSTRVCLLAMATALVALLVATSSASAATFGGGTIKLGIKLTGTSVSTKGHSAKSTFPFAENAGVATMTKQASGSLNIGTTSTSLTIKRANKSIVLQSLVEKLTAGKGQLTAKIGGKGKAIAFFDQASTNRVAPDSGFTQLIMSSSNMTLTSAGAAALNKAFGLKAPRRGQKDLRLKAKAKAGTASFTAGRTLTVVGGSSSTIYDTAFYDALKDCDITLGSVAPATAIPADAAAPRGGVQLPINASNGGTLTAATLIGQVNHQGGTVLDRPAGGPKGKAAYNSPLTNFVFGFGPPQNTLVAFVVNANNSLPIGTVSGTPTANLTDTGGSVSLTGGTLNLSDTAAGTLSQSAPPLGADCPIPAGSKIGAINMTANVE